MTNLPRAARLALGLNRFLAGALPADEVSVCFTGDLHHVFVGLDTEVLGPLEAVARIRQRTSRVSVALPAPGHPIGLAGPPSFNSEASDAGEALLLPDAELGLIPVVVGGAVEWRCSTASAPPALDVREARQALRATLREVTEELAALQVASWNSAIPDLLLDPHAFRDRDLAFMTPDSDTLTSATLCLAIVTAAHEVEPGAVTAGERHRFEAAVRRLDSAARTALVAVCSATSDSLTSP